MGTKKPAGYPAEPFGSDSLQAFGCAGTGDRSSGLLEADKVWVQGKGDEAQSVV